MLKVWLAALMLAWSALPAGAQVGDGAGTAPLDPALVLRALAFDESGTFVGPAARDFWERVFESDRIPDDPERELRGVDPTPRIDAAFVLAATCTGPPPAGRNRLRALAFVQRVFRDRGDGELPAALVAARAVSRYPALMLSVERMGIEDVRVYTALARAAGRVDRITEPLLLRNVLSQFQGALALVEQARLANAVTPDAAAAALLALAELPLARRGGFDGAVAEWLGGRLLPALGVPVAPSFESHAMDEQLLAALAGGAGAERPLVEWEGLTYRFDRRAAQLERFSRTRVRLGGNRLDAVLALSAVASSLASGAGAELAPLIEQLARSVTGIRAPRVGLYVPGTVSGTYADQIRPIVEDLQASAEAGREGPRPDVAGRLRRVVDVLLADLLRTLPYVVHLSNGHGVELLGTDIAARHEFGVRIGDREDRVRAPWLLPRGQSAPAPPFHRLGDFWIAPDGEDRFTGAWHVYGALTSLDLAFAHLYLPRFSGAVPPAAPAFSAPEEAHFARGVALFNPSAATRDQVARIAGAIRRGRERVARLTAGTADIADVARGAGLGPARRNELAWTLRKRPEALGRFFSRTELLWLGLNDAGSGGVRPPAGWGAPAVWLDGCLCVRIPPPDAADLSVAPAGRLASQFADLPLALAEAVDELGLPAPVVGELLPLATRELLDGVRAVYASAGARAAGSPVGGGGAVGLRSSRGRWRALVRQVHDLPRSRIEDYVASLVGPGRPLRPVEMTGLPER